MKRIENKLVLCIIFVILLVACIGSPKAPKEDEVMAKSFTKDPNNSVIYVYRGSTQAGRTFRLHINDNFVGASNNYSFFRIINQPGKQFLVITDVRNNIQDAITIFTKENELYYVEIAGDPIIVSKLKLTIIEDKLAKPKISKYSLLKAEVSRIKN
jgi:hypothetical protein